MRRGTEIAKELETYLKTGELTLSPIALAGKHLLPVPGTPTLEVEAPLGDFYAALALRDTAIRTGNANAAEIKKIAGLAFHGIPFMGSADFRQRTGLYVDSDGKLKREDLGMIVGEICDHKSTRVIDSYITRTGKLVQGYAKTTDQILNLTQMLGYGEAYSLSHPDLTHIRLGHIYYATGGTPSASKRTGLLTVQEVHRRIERLDNVVSAMVHTAEEKDPNKVEYNENACHAYNKDCPHMSYCDRPKRSLNDLLQIGVPKMSTGLFESLAKPTNGTTTTPSLPQPATQETIPVNIPANTQMPMGLFAPPSIPAPTLPAPTPLSETERAAAIAAEKARLLAEDALHTAQMLNAVATAKTQIASGTLKLDGSGQVFTKEGAEAGWILRPPTAAESVAFVAVAQQVPATIVAGSVVSSLPPPPIVPTVVKPVPHIGAINPADAPPFDPIAAADPLSPEVIATIEDPEIKARAIAHAAAVTERKATAKAALPTKEKTAGRCDQGGKKVMLTIDQAMTKRVLCACGKEVKVKPTKEGDGYVADLPGHIVAKAAPTVSSISEPAPAAMSAPSPPVISLQPLPPVPLLPILVPTLPSPESMNGYSDQFGGEDFPDPKTITVPVTPTQPVVSTGSAVTAVPIENSRDVAALLDKQTTKTQQAAGITLFIDVPILHGTAPDSLDDWFKDILQTMCNTYKVNDIRMADKGSPLSFGGWRPQLEMMVRENPPKSGTYLIKNTVGSELWQVVLFALVPMCQLVVGSIR